MQLTNDNILDNLVIGDIMYVASPFAGTGSKVQSYIYCGVMGNMIIFVDADKDSQKCIRYPVNGLLFLQEIMFGAFTTEREAREKLAENYRIVADQIDKELKGNSLTFGVDFNGSS